MRRVVYLVGLAALVACERSETTAPTDIAAARASAAVSGVNVLLNTPATAAILTDLRAIGPIVDQIPSINAVTIRASTAELELIRSKPYVAAAEVDAATHPIQVNPLLAVADFSAGRSSWNQDAIGITLAPGFTGRNPALNGLTGQGVYIGVLDSGLLSTWADYFPAERFAFEYARSFGGGGGDVGTISSQPNKWMQDVNSHGTHVISTIIGYTHAAGDVNGTAPLATIIPIKILNQNGRGWWSVIARGLVYLADLKVSGELDAPLIVNMSIVGDRIELMERAIDYAIANGVIVVIAAGNDGTEGMSWPAAYPPAISVAAYGFTNQWEDCSTGAPEINTWWRLCDVADPTDLDEFFIAEFSARPLTGQQLDLAAPGDNIVGAYQYNNGQQPGRFFLSGTSMATPHVAGVAALMAEKYPALTQAQAEFILKQTAIPFPAGTRSVYDNIVDEYVTRSWQLGDSGAGLVNAVAAVAATP